MRPTLLNRLFAPVTALPGIGPSLGRLIERAAGPLVVDLLWHLPTGLVDRRTAPSIGALDPRDWADAIECYQAPLSTERDSVKAAKVRNNLGAALEKLGKSDEALEQFSQALQINGNYPEAHCNLGRMLAQRGRRDEAVAHLREALRLKPGYEQARKQLRELDVIVTP